MLAPALLSEEELENISPGLSMNGSIFIREVFWRLSRIMEDQIVIFIIRQL
jgi:hypothetical protein